MLPVLAAAALVLIALPMSAYVIGQAGEHGHDLWDAVFLLLVLGGLTAALGMATYYPDWVMRRSAPSDVQSVSV